LVHAVISKKLTRRREGGIEEGRIRDGGLEMKRDIGEEGLERFVLA
jgi:hypothetical protein